MKTPYILIATIVLGLAVCGCETPPGPFVPRPLSAKLVYCNDHTGHQAGAKPWIDGGTCCCTPSEELLAQYQKDGFCGGQTIEQLVARYQAKGIKLAGPGHRHCSGLCELSPHVVLGGSCMAPPTPCTAYYDRIVTGQVPPKAPADKN